MGDTEELIFDESNANWVKDPESNDMFLKLQEQYFNHRLNTVGHVFYNDLRQSLGFPPVRQGVMGGWVLGGKPGWVDIRIGDNRLGAISVKIHYQADILDDVWPLKEDG